MLRRAFVSLAAGMAAMATAGSLALAADLAPRNTSPVSPAIAANIWTGPYLGLFAGLSAIDAETSLTIHPYRLNLESFGGSGIMGDVRAGYDVEFDSVILGVEGSFGFDGAKVKFDGLDFTAKADRKWILNGSLRLGLALSSESMIYALGGISASRLKYKSAWGGTLPGSYSISDTFAGYHVGGGMEHRLVEGVALRMEYRYTDMEKQSYTWGGAKVTVDPDFHEFMIGISWRF